MTNSEILKEAEKLMKACVDKFLLQIKKYRQNSRAKNIQKGHLDFSIFYPLNDEYSESKHFERKLVDDIRNNLVLSIFEKLFDLHNIQIEYPTRAIIIGESNLCRVKRLSHKDFPFEFIVDINGVRKGYLFDYPLEYEYEEDCFFELITHQYNIDQIEILVFDENTQIGKKNKKISESLRYYEKYISLESFFDKYFSIEIYKLYLTLVRKAVHQANEEIGLRTIRTMSGQNLSNFKALFLPQYATLPYESEKYIFSDTQNYITGCITEEDYTVLNKIFVKGELYKAFVGNEDFAKSFITSEYLFNSVGEKELFDYTSVICGYTKSVEQLLYKLLEINLVTSSSQNLWIKTSIPIEKLPNEIKIQKHSKFKLIPFIIDNKRYFNTMLNPMIDFVQKNTYGWNVSESAKNFIIKCLRDYAKSCRNDHFHKDNIYDYETVKRIRNNTILVFYYLLGGYKLTNDIEKNHSLLGIESNSFDLLYKKICEIPRSINRFILLFGDKQILAVRLYDQELSIYDENGSLRESVLYFYPVEKFGENDYDYACKSYENNNVIIVDNNNIPEKVWWYDISKDERHPIEW